MRITLKNNHVGSVSKVGRNYHARVMRTKGPGKFSVVNVKASSKSTLEKRIQEVAPGATIG